MKEIFKLLVRDAFAKKSGMEFDVASNLSLVFKMNHAETELDFQFLTGTFQLMVEIPASKLKVTTKRAKGIVRHQGASGDKIASAVMKVGLADFVNHRQCPPPLVETIPQISDLSFQLEPIFIAGRYCKLERHISNSIWIINGQRLAEHSMEELIGDHLDAFFEAKGHKFSSAGREDSDVLMLGDGRPFYFELVSPARGSASKVELEQLRQSMIESSNGKIHVRDLQIVTRESTSVLKESASSKSKSYRCATLTLGAP